MNLYFEFKSEYLPNNLNSKALSKIVADGILYLYLFFSAEIKPGISCESSAEQMIHMKCQVLFSLKIKKKNQSCLL